MSDIIEITRMPYEYEITIVEEPTTVTILANGSQGPQGPPGPSGVAFQHTQTDPASNWVVSHNLGRPANVEVYTTAGVRVIPDVSTSVPDFLVTTISFGNPATGYAVFS